LHISMQELCDTVVRPKRLQKGGQTKSKMRRKVVSHDTESEENEEEEALDEIESNIEDYIIVGITQMMNS
jgi:hypothetical protein